MKVVIDYPSDESEKEILRLIREENKGKVARHEPFPQGLIFSAREEIKQVQVSEAAEQYIVDLISATRYPEKYNEQLAKWIDFGASPRGTIGLEKSAQVMAWLNERDYVDPDDIRKVIHEVLRHRLILSYEANAEHISADQVIDELLKVVAVV